MYFMYNILFLQSSLLKLLLAFRLGRLGTGRLDLRSRLEEVLGELGVMGHALGWFG